MARKPPAGAKAIVAAGAPVKLNQGSRTIKALRSGTDTAWQDEAWGYYDLVGEFRYAVDLSANLISKARLTIEYLGDDGKFTTATDGPAVEALAEFYNGPVNHPSFLREAAISMSVPGEFFTVAWSEDDQVHWRTVPRGAITSTEKRTTLYGEKLPGDPLVMHAWEPHPRDYRVPNSPSRALLGTLGEIHRLSQHVQAQVISRLATAGLFLITDNVNVSPPEGLIEDDKIASMSNGDAFVAQLTAAMEAAIRDRSSASAVVPIVLEVPQDAIEKFRHITFWSELDENSKQMRDDAIGRLALGMDIPPEALTGTGELNHWQAWLTDETAIKAHTQPLLYRIAASMTQAYLYPAIKDQASDWHRYRIGVDDSGMRIRPNRSKESIELYDRGELSAEAMLRENGFEDEDAMTEAERREWLTKKIASGSTTPELVAAAIEKMGVLLQTTYVEGEVGQEARPDRSLKGHPVRDFPQDRPEEQKPDPALVAAMDVLTLRALERAGNRIKQVVQSRPENVTAAEYYQFSPSTGKCANPDYLLEDAWTHVGEFAAEYGLDAASLTQALDTYTRQLIANKTPRDKGMLRRYLEKVDPC